MWLGRVKGYYNVITNPNKILDNLFAWVKFEETVLLKVSP
jgi:hypothetical protein